MEVSKCENETCVLALSGGPGAGGWCIAWKGEGERGGRALAAYLSFDLYLSRCLCWSQSQRTSKLHPWSTLKSIVCNIITISHWWYGMVPQAPSNPNCLHKWTNQFQFPHCFVWEIIRSWELGLDFCSQLDMIKKTPLKFLCRGSESVLHRESTSRFSTAPL